MRPRSITGSAGSRIRLLFGETGSDYLYFFNEDDGTSEWQSSDWTIGPGGFPNGLAKQLNNIIAKDRYVEEVAFGPNDEWYVYGIKRDGTGGYSWWGGCSNNCSAKIKELTTGSCNRLQVCFGRHSSSLLIVDNNGYSFSYIDEDLVKRVKMINREKGTIHLVRLFADGGYFIRDSEGSQWKGLGTHLAKEVKKGGTINDVAVAGDGSWVVIRPNNYVSSKGVSEEVTQLLTKFYNRHRSRQSSQGQRIQQYDARIRREKEERESARRLEEQKQQQLEAAQMKRDAQERLEAIQKAVREKQFLEEIQKAEREKQNLEEATKRKREIEERQELIQKKRIKEGDRVTALNISNSPGDLVVDSINSEGILEVHNTDGYPHLWHVTDPSRLIRYENTDYEEDVEKINLLCFAADEYEAAVSLFQCKCSGDGTCLCKRVLSARAPLGVDSPNSVVSVGTRRSSFNAGDRADLVRFVREKSTRPLLEHRGEVLRVFDEYRCPEKIDFEALKRIRQDLQLDSTERKDCFEFQKSRPNLNETDEKNLKKLQKCQLLEALVESLYDMLKDFPADNDGCVVHEVEYEQRDPSFRGRLFAKGKVVKVEGDIYPRSATLQGMHKDLRAALVGKFAHDIDCENSEVRLICSLAAQHNLESLIPTIIQYRDNRGKWLELIQSCHNVSEADAKRLPNIILSGGRYETWARSMKVVPMDKQSTDPDLKKLKKFVFDLYAQCHAIRDKLLEHPRFGWTSVDQNKLINEDGKSENKAKSELLPTIVRSCENEVLGLIHRHFAAQGCRVRAKVFDGLVAEPGPDAKTKNLVEVMKSAETACLSFGWDIRLLEKPLFRLHNEPIETIQEGRRASKQLPGVHFQSVRVGYIRVHVDAG